MQASDFKEIELDDPESMENGEATIIDDEGDTTRIAIPVPGFYTSEWRLVSTTCAICLCEYEVGSDVVWSSNPLCDHAFHADCIERWLLKQRGRPLCPCCRRDFVVDPLDEDDDEQAIPVANDDQFPVENHEDGSMDDHHNDTEAMRSFM